MIQIKEISEKSRWEDFNLANPNPSFLQSWAWGEFQKNLGRQFYRFGIYEGSKLVGMSLVYAEAAKLGSYLYCPAGPILKNLKTDHFARWVEFVSSLSKEKNHVFLRIDPRVLDEGIETLVKEAGFTQAPEYTQPQCTAIINLTKSEEELRHGLSSSTRYNINAAERKGVKVREGKKEEIEVFLALLKETAKRKTLVLPHEENYHKIQFETLEKESLMKLYIAEDSSQPLSAALVVNYADISYYLHAANALEKKELRASYPLVWHTILESKKAKVKKFDFWGVAPTDDPKHPWSGVTSFKLSFGAERECYDPPWDLPFSNNYQLMKVVETWRRPVRKILRFGR
ncbi:MAG: peptidoglycan bridge formation glycyltransferase FemA/FemB family protein [bacterium]|nr:peptidoglycan bridge formation glycyltransferase FemA/FemB family protein [bacterium]